MMLKTVIFDMDGVIVDSEPVHHLAYQLHFEQLNISVSDELYASFTGNSTKNIYQKLKEKFQLSESIEDLVNTKRALFNEAFDNKLDLDLIAGVLNLIKDLKQNQVQLLLASSSARVTIERVFNRFDLHQYFSGIFSGEEFPQSKPHPALFLAAWHASGHDKASCLVIEDSTNGLIAAAAAGIKCLGFDSFHSKGQDYSLAQMVTDDFDKINFKVLNELLKVH
jgi:HAD superfamily hydrolase (TIGR01509 family)